MRFCSQACRFADRNKKPERSGHTHERRAKKFGRQYEVIDKWAIFARDKWRCQLCGVKTPRGLSGTADPRAPELDHIIPLAVGGHHVESNVQCACARCNRGKSAWPLGQLLIDFGGQGLEV